MLKNPFILILLTAILILVSVGGLVVYKNYSDSKNMMKDESMMPKDSMMEEDKMDSDENMVKDDSSMMMDSRYVEYSKEVLDKAADSRRVLFFYANWCPTCRPADKNFSENVSKIPQDLTLIRVNYNDSDTDNEEKDLAKKYNVTYQHTFVQIDSTGKEIKKWNGGQIEELLANIK